LVILADAGSQRCNDTPTLGAGPGTDVIGDSPERSSHTLPPGHTGALYIAALRSGPP